MEQKQDMDVEADPLKCLYYRNKDILVKEIDMLQLDVTESFEYYLEDKIENRELINISIKGEVSGSKSTSAIATMDKINKLIENKYNKKIERYEHILSDQTEFIRFMMKVKNNTCIVIDEFSRIAEIGLNASTEDILFDHYSDVFAQRFVHRVCCSPTRILDKNSNIVLEYIGKDEKAKISKFKLMYRNTAESYQLLTLGYVIINVGEILDEDFYKKYRAKKFKRMELIDKHGVRDIRELEFADIILDVVENLKDSVKDGNKMELGDMIQAVISRICREKKKIYSLLTTNEIASRVRNILGLYSLIYKTRIKLSKAKNDVERSALLDKSKKVEEILKTELEEEIKRREIYEDYLNIK